jgi:hypothetical protein
VRVLFYGYSQATHFMKRRPCLQEWSIALK